jgi:hypothetical protein
MVSVAQIKCLQASLVFETNHVLTFMVFIPAGVAASPAQPPHHGQW